MGVRNVEQFALMEDISDVVVALSETMWKVVFVVKDVNGAVVSTPPGREALLASPYFGEPS